MKVVLASDMVAERYAYVGAEHSFRLSCWELLYSTLSTQGSLCLRRFA